MQNYKELEEIYGGFIEEVEEETLDVYRHSNLVIAAERFIEHLEDEGITLTEEIKKQFEYDYCIKFENDEKVIPSRKLMDFIFNKL